MRLTAVLAAVAFSSCSLIGTRRPDPPPYTERPQCAPNYGRPLADTFIAAGGLAMVGLAGALAVSTGGKNTDGTSNVATLGLMGATGVGLAGVFGTSAVIGYPRVSACVDAIAEWDQGEPERRRLAAVEADLARASASAASAAARERLTPEALLAAAVAVTKCEEGLSSKTKVEDGSFLIVHCERELACVESLYVAERDSLHFRCAETPASFERLQQRAVRERLSLETGCPVASISVEARSTLERGMESAYRLLACSKRYVCSSSPRGFDCKAALGD